MLIGVCRRDTARLKAHSRPIYATRRWSQELCDGLPARPAWQRLLYAFSVVSQRFSEEDELLRLETGV